MLYEPKSSGGNAAGNVFSTEDKYESEADKVAAQVVGGGRSAFAESPERELIGHEAAHVVQQPGGRAAESPHAGLY